MRRYLTTTFLFLSILLAAGGCSVRQVATDTLADTLASNDRTFASDDDPELIRAAAPFGLKLIESTLAAAPQHRGLLLAAARSAGLRTEPAPYVLQRSLSDFYVQYELRANLQRTEEWFSVQSALNGHIQDVFNEFGVQIMSPHFMVQPDKSVVVPKFQWYAPPAQPEPAPLPGKRDGA